MVLPNPESETARPEPSEEVLRAFNEWLAKDRGLGKRPDNSRQPIAEGQTYIPPQVPQSEKLDKADSHPKLRPSVFRRAFRTFAFGVVAVIIALSGIIWQQEIRDMGKLARSLHGSITAPPPGSPPSAPTSSNQTVLDSSANAAMQNAAPPEVTPSSSGPPQVSEGYVAFQRQIEDLMTKVDAIRNIVDQLAVNQKQMEQMIAAIKATQDSLDQKLLSVAPRATAAHPTLRKRTPELQPTRRPASTGQSVGSPLPLH